MERKWMPIHEDAAEDEELRELVGKERAQAVKELRPAIEEQARRCGAKEQRPLIYRMRLTTNEPDWLECPKGKCLVSAIREEDFLQWIAVNAELCIDGGPVTYDRLSVHVNEQRGTVSISVDLTAPE